jgi:eukaryotic-like serine/threonine-protein kinase
LSTGGFVIKFVCACGKIANVGDDFTGKKVKCRSCGKVAVVPAMAPAGDGNQQTAVIPGPDTPAEVGDRLAHPALDPPLDAVPLHAQPADADDSATGAFDGSAVGGTPKFAPPAEPGEVGTLGPYRVIKELGRGGMGAVYLARDARLNRKLALKVMLPQFTANKSARERFLREARAAAQINHDNVVPVFEADEREGVPFIAMPFLQGYPLDEYLQKKGNLTAQQIIRVGRETAAGLAAAHELGLIHRDIKPANLWLEAPSGRVKILDFGLARPVDAAGEVTKSGAIIGTPSFMAPEQAAGEKVDHRADLFSLGAVLYRLATGRNPFAGENVMAILMNLASREPAPLRSANPDIPDAVAELIHRLLAKDPAARPQTAQEVADAFAGLARAHAAGELSASSPPPLATATAATTPVREVVYVQIPVTMMPENSLFADIDVDDEPTELDRPKAERPQAAKPSGMGIWVAVGLAAVVAIALVGIVILKVTGPDGKETTVEVPSGSTVKIDSKGKIDVTLPKDKKAPPPLKKEGPPPDKGPPAPAAPMDLLMRDTTPWTVLKPIEMKSEGEATLTLQDDGSILVSGKQPLLDVYTLTFRGLPASIQALRLEVLPHDSLPRKGPGRAVNGRFVLTEIKAQFDPPAKTGEPRQLKLAEARADAPTNADIREHLAIDGNDGTGWALDANEAGKPHFAVLKLAESVAAADGAVLRVALEFKHSPKHQLGCFRLSAAQADPDRAAAEYILSVGGSVQVDGNARDIIKAAGELPKAAFRLTAVTAGGPRMTDAGLAVFKDCKHLTALYMPTAPNITAAGFAHFAGNKNLTEVTLFSTRITDAGLAALKDCANLTYLNVHKSMITGAGLAHLKNCKNLTTLYVDSNPFTDEGLAHLKGCPNLTRLEVQNTKVTAAGVDELQKALPKCKIGWDGEAAAWARSVAAMPAEQQVTAVASRLRKLNPGFDGQVTPTFEKDAVIGLKFSPVEVTDISPVRALTRLETLNIADFPSGKGSLVDLSPLQGMSLVHLYCGGAKVSNLSPLKGMKLRTLSAQNNPISDLTPLVGMPLTRLDLHAAIQVTNLAPLQGMALEYLNLSRFRVSDISLLKGMKSLRFLVLDGMPLANLASLEGLALSELQIRDTPVSDLAPLKGMMLKKITFTPKNITQGLDILRDMKSLKTIGIGNGQALPAAEFWDRYDKGEFK